jgi:hypothetical protein
MVYIKHALGFKYLMTVERVINLLGILVLLSERQRRAHIDQVMHCARLVAS